MHESLQPETEITSENEQESSISFMMKSFPKNKRFINNATSIPIYKLPFKNNFVIGDKKSEWNTFTHYILGTCIHKIDIKYITYSGYIYVVSYSKQYSPITLVFKLVTI